MSQAADSLGAYSILQLLGLHLGQACWQVLLQPPRLALGCRAGASADAWQLGSVLAPTGRLQTAGKALIMQISGLSGGHAKPAQTQLQRQQRTVTVLDMVETMPVMSF